jgi:hypothetical protein
MATVTEMRTRLREAGEEVPARGRLGPDHIARYRELADSEPSEPWDVGGGDELASPDEAEPDVPMTPEQSPRTPRSARRARPVGERIFGRRDPKTQAGKGKVKKIPRMSLEHLVGRGWEAIARFSAPLSLPVSRCLQVQSPVAVMILEEVVAGTTIDRFLQPVARAEAKAEKVLALVAPPILVLAIEQSQQLPPQQMMMRQAFLMPMLKESLRVWLQVAGPKVEEAARKEAEYQEKFGHTIDEMIGLFFGPQQTTSEVIVDQPEMAGAAA